MIARVLPVATAAVLLALTAGPAAAQMRPGQWEVTIATEIPGMPAGMPGMAPHTMRHCVTEADVRDPGRMVEGASQGGCKLTRSEQKGSAFEFEMRCTQPPATSRGRYTFSGDSYQGVVQMEMEEGGEKMAMTSRTTARRLGDCPK